MKKSLMALSLALCATFVFAQVPAKKASLSTLKDKHVEKVAVSQVNENAKQSTYKGSIFTKDAVVMPTVEFSEGPGTNYTVGKTSKQRQAYASSSWFRVPDTSVAAVRSVNAPVLFGAGNRYGYGDEGLSRLFQSASPSNGFMAMSMQDQISSWGGTGTLGAFDAYIAFPPFTTAASGDEAIEILDVNLYQFYRAFNNDKCIIDYSIDGTNWDTIEFNISRIDVPVNQSTRGFKTITLPTSLLEQGNVYIRIRWFCNSNGGGAYGYFWMIDDVSVTAGKASRLRPVNYSFQEGAYHQMPAELGACAVVWSSLFKNNGAIDQTNVVGYVESVDGTNIATSQVMAKITPSATKDTMALIDNFYNRYYPANHPSFLGYGHRGTSSSLPHATAGIYDIKCGLRSDSLEFVYDTIRYTVNAPQDGNHIWGRDNGILTKDSYWTWGASLEEENTITQDGAFNEAGFYINMKYSTPASVPENWVIRGVELVATTVSRYLEDVSAGIAKINPLLFYDSLTSDATGVYVKQITTGSGVHTVLPEEVNGIGTDTITTYLMPGEYNTIRIMFPEQPALKSGVSYRIGYQLVEQAFFCVASDRNYYYEGNDIVYYSENEALKPYAVRFGNGNAMNVQGYTPGTNRTWLGSFAGKNVPMMRMIVGPKQNIPTYNITFTAEGPGAILDEATNVVEGSVAVAQGSIRSYYIAPDSVIYDVKSILLDGTEIIGGNTNLEYNEAGGYYIYTFQAISANHSLKAVFGSNVGINNSIADNVTIKLQPNPANASTKLTISGINGNVNFSLIDMSGRVLSQEVINANEIKDINVANLAKGTYFVRLTNSNFTKVEKLIVR